MWEHGQGAPPGLPGPGHLLNLPVATPAAGADWTTRVPTGARWRLLGGSAQLVTSATVATRQVHLTVSMDGLELFRVPAAATQLAGLTVVYELLPGYTVTTAVGIYQPLFTPVSLVLDPRMVLATVTGSIQAADQWSAVVLLLEELTTLPYAAAAGQQAPGAQAQE